MKNQIYPDGDKVSVTFQYDPDYVRLVKTIAGRRYLKTPIKHWEIPFTPWHCQQLLNTFKDQDFEIDDAIYESAKNAEKMKQKSNRTKSKRKMGRLREYQVAGVEFMQEAKGRCLNCDQMGLGKTAQVLMYAERDIDIKKILVVAPATITYNWGIEIEKWTTYSWAVVSTSKEPLPYADILIMSYNIAARRYTQLMYMQFDLLVFDEFHYIKNPKAKRTRAAKLYAMASPRVIGLSGTPMLSRPIEMLNMLQIIQPDSWDTTEYAFQYCGGWNSGYWAKGATNTEELADRLRTVMVRRTKDEVDLPDLTRTYIPVEIDKKEYKKVALQVADAIHRLNPEHKGYYVNALDKLNMLRQVVGDAKAKASMEWIKNFLDSQEENVKLVLYVHHRFVVEELTAKLHEYGVTTITGDTPNKRRMERIQSFQTPGGPRVIIITAAGGEGINLYGVGGVDASTILFVERQWTPAMEEQAESRLHRIGQKNAVNAYYLVAKDTIDEKINDLINSKRSVIDEVIGTETTEVTIVKDLLDLIKGEK